MNNKIKGMTTCSVCNRDFPLIVENHYISRGPKKTGLNALVDGFEPILYDSFNCPYCGCQNNIQQRNHVYVGILLSEDKEETDKDEESKDIEESIESIRKYKPVCNFPIVGGCYYKRFCSPTCEFHPDYKSEENT